MASLRLIEATAIAYLKMKKTHLSCPKDRPCLFFLVLVKSFIWFLLDFMIIKKKTYSIFFHCECVGDDEYSSEAIFIKKLESTKNPRPIELHKKLATRNRDAYPNFRAEFFPV